MHKFARVLSIGTHVSFHVNDCHNKSIFDRVGYPYRMAKTPLVDINMPKNWTLLILIESYNFSHCIGIHKCLAVEYENLEIININFNEAFALSLNY